MNPSSKLEALLMTVGAGATGVNLLQDYSIKTPELKYFINYCKTTTVTDLSFHALAPNEEMGRIADKVKVAYNEVRDNIPNLETEHPARNDINKIKESIDNLYALLQGMYSTVNDGRTIL